jgi:hypothetical protein
MHEHTHSGRVKLFLFDVAEIFEELLPSFTEKPGLVPTAPSLLNLLSIHGLETVSHDFSESRQQFDDLLKERR